MRKCGISKHLNGRSRERFRKLFNKLVTYLSHKLVQNFCKSLSDFLNREDELILAEGPPTLFGLDM